MYNIGHQYQAYPSKGGESQGLGATLGSVAITIAIKVLQACIYTSLHTGLFKSLEAKGVVKFNTFILGFTF